MERTLQDLGRAQASKEGALPTATGALPQARRLSRKAGMRMLPSASRGTMFVVLLHSQEQTGQSATWVVAVSPTAGACLP